MAKNDQAVTKEPGRIKQLWQIFNLTRETDKALIPLLLLTLIAPIGAGVALALVLASGSILTLILYITTGVLLALLLTLVVMGQRAEKTDCRYASNPSAARYGGVGRAVVERLNGLFAGPLLVARLKSD